MYVDSVTVEQCNDNICQVYPGRLLTMPIDRFKLSIEGRPLLSLYSKYGIEDSFSSQPGVRPLGRVRTETPITKGFDSGFIRDSDDVNRLRRYNTDTDLIMNRSVDNDKFRNLRKSEHIFNNLEAREREPGTSGVSRIRRQEFENKFKIAASRTNGGESPPPKPTREFSKKVINLPCFQINLRTYEGEHEVTRAVARTRESLRQLIDMQKSKAKANHLVTANIMNYEFLGPSKTNSARSSSEGSSGPTLLPFPSKPAIKTPTRQREIEICKNGLTLGRVEPAKFGAYGSQEEGEIKTVFSDRDAGEVTPARRRLDRLVQNNDVIDVNNSALSAAIRPDMTLTLGSTMYHIDGAITSTDNDELKEISEVFKRADSQTTARSSPNSVNIRHAASSGQGSRSRLGMSVQDMEVARSVERQYVTKSRTSDHNCSGSASAAMIEMNRRNKPVLRYTSKPDSYKLDPIVVPSHTCTECSMCNMFQRDLIESPCPPNSPMSSQFMESPFCVQSADLLPEAGPNRDERTSRKPQLLPMSRITVAGNITPSDEQSVRSYMKAKG